MIIAVQSNIVHNNDTVHFNCYVSSGIQIYVNMFVITVYNILKPYVNFRVGLIYAELGLGSVGVIGFITAVFHVNSVVARRQFDCECSNIIYK